MKKQRRFFTEKLKRLPGMVLLFSMIFSLSANDVFYGSEVLETDSLGSYEDEVHNTVTGFVPNEIIEGIDDLFYDQEDTEEIIISADLPVTVSLFAGTGLMGYGAGDRKTVPFITPQGIFVDDKGVLYVADGGSHLISRIEGRQVLIAAGKVTAVNAFGIPIPDLIREDTQDMAQNMPPKAQDLQLHNPGKMVSDHKGNLYFTDRNHHRIYKIDALSNSPVVLAGSGSPGYADGNGTEAAFNAPFGIGVDKEGNVYVADTLNHCIRRIDEKGNVSLFAGKAAGEGSSDGNLFEARFCEPMDIFMKESGELYVADSGNSLIRKIEDGRVITIAGNTLERDEYNRVVGSYKDGVGIEAGFNKPKGIWAAENLLYVADTENNSIRVIEETTGIVRTLCGNKETGNVIGAQNQVRFNKPFGVALYQDKLYVSDSLNNAVKVVLLSEGEENED